MSAPGRFGFNCKSPGGFLFPSGFRARALAIPERDPKRQRSLPDAGDDDPGPVRRSRPEAAATPKICDLTNPTD
jgi:hypothetical protein